MNSFVTLSQKQPQKASEALGIIAEFDLEIQDPSGEVRRKKLRLPSDPTGEETQDYVLFSLPGERDIASVVGTTPFILLKDSALPKELGKVRWICNPKSAKRSFQLWIDLATEVPPLRIGDLYAKSCELALHLEVQIGETRLTLKTSDAAPDLPRFPSGAPAWLTSCESGKKLLWMAKKAAPTPLSIYIGGETGTGKEVIAHLLHLWSDRASGPFVPINCGALPISLAESELFGHVKGAFTGASQPRPGALLQAHGGTVFLDEVGDLPLDIQVKLLRFLENGEIRQVGADRTSRTDARVICATHHSLKQLVEEGKFRRDLYYRLASITLEIPTLRSRPEDILLLSQKFAKDLGRALSPSALLRLQSHAWPGNVRELRHAIERASGLSGPFTSLLSEDAFEFLITPESIENAPEIELGSGLLTLDEMERVMLLKSLRLSNGNRSRAAQILGVARSTLFEMMKRHRVQGPKSFEPWTKRSA